MCVILHPEVPIIGKMDIVYKLIMHEIDKLKIYTDTDTDWKNNISIILENYVN